MTGESIHYKKQLGLYIVQYCQLHEEDTRRNSNQPCTKGAICMGPSVNIQGGFKFIRLRSMKNIKRRYWDIIPMPDTVIYHINILGKYQQELLIFTSHKGQLVEYGDAKLTVVDGDGD